MHVEIEKLIKYAVADGDLTEKKRAIILRKAETLGEDKDEVEMIIDGEMALASKEENKNQLSNNISTKEGNLKKCPSCGSPVPSFSLKCNDCGHEFRNTEATASIKEFFNQIKSAKLEDRAIIISSFPIPNNKEDLIEFISVSLANSKEMTAEERNSYLVVKVFSVTPMPQLVYRENEIKAWKAKAEAAMMKAKVLFSDNPTPLMMENILKYEKKFEVHGSLENKTQERNKIYILIIIIAFFIATYFITK